MEGGCKRGGGGRAGERKGIEGVEGRIGEGRQGGWREEKGMNGGGREDVREEK